MDNNRIYHWSARVSAELLNVHIDCSECKAVQFQRILCVIYRAMIIAVTETREEMLEPSDN